MKSSTEGDKSVGVVIQRGAGEAPDVEEALRVALGQTLAAGRVIVAFVGAGVWAAAPPPVRGEQATEIEKHLGRLVELGHELGVEADALKVEGIPRVREGITVGSRGEVLSRLEGVDVILAL
jgi:hypothetical protein